MLAVVGAGLFTGYRMAHRALKKQKTDPKPDVDTDEPRDLGSVEWDEATGAYRPRHH